MPRYSRLAQTEEKKNTKKAYIFVGLSIISILLLIFLGIPAIVKMAAFLADLRSSNTTISQDDTTPPAPPQFDTLPEATNQENIDIKGTSEVGGSVEISLNGEAESVVVKNDGEFVLNVALSKGTNTISAIAKDTSGNESVRTEEQIIRFDNEKPDLAIKSPEDGASFFGSKQRQVNIEGITESDSEVHVNDRFVTVDSDGTFVYTTTLQTGSNVFVIKSKDLAGNESEAKITLNFSE